MSVLVVGGLARAAGSQGVRHRTLMPRALALTGYLFSVVAANFASVRWPPFAVAGLLVPAGTLFAGMTLTARDVLYDAMGARWVAVGMAVGAGISAALVSPGVAVASVAAFTVSELVDTLAYTWLRHRHRLVAVAVSNVAGLVTDSLLFVPLVFGSFVAVSGQVAGKAAATGLALVVLHFGHRRAVAGR